MHQGFERFFILNGHGGNKLPQRLADLNLDTAARIVWYDWWRETAVKRFEAEHNIRLDHANWGENFPFNRVAESPTGTKIPVNLGLFDAGHSMREVLGDGNYGGPYQVADDLMEELFMRVVDEVTERVQALGEG